MGEGRQCPGSPSKGYGRAGGGRERRNEAGQESTTAEAGSGRGRSATLARFSVRDRARRGSGHRARLFCSHLPGPAPAAHAGYSNNANPGLRMRTPRHSNIETQDRTTQLVGGRARLRLRVAPKPLGSPASSWLSRHICLSTPPREPLTHRAATVARSGHEQLLGSDPLDSKPVPCP